MAHHEVAEAPQVESCDHCPLVVECNVAEAVSSILRSGITVGMFDDEIIRAAKVNLFINCKFREHTEG